MKKLKLTLVLLFCSFHMAFAQNLQNGLVAYYPFNRNANDESTNGHNGTVLGATLTEDRFNCLSSAYLFDGIDDFIQIPTSASLRSAHYSLSLWLKTTQEPQVQSIPFSGNYHLSSISGNGYQLEINPQGEIGVDQFTRPTVNHGGNMASGPINDGSWHHIVSSWDGQTTSVYVDGVLTGTQQTPCCNGAQPGPIRWTAPFQDFKIGFKSGSQQLQLHEYYAGVLDDIRVYNRALNAAEIGSLFNLVQPICNSNPLANAGPDQTLECTSPQGSVVTLDGSNSSDPDNDPLTYTWRENGAILAGPTTSPTSQVTLDLGSHTIELTVDDGNGGTDTDDVVIQVQDTTPPTIQVSASPIVLWPPNHNYSSIDITQYVTAVSDNCASLSASDVVITQVSSDEEEDAKGGGDGNTIDDIVITSCSTVDVRAERQGGGNGRVYTINLEVDDGNGNSANAELEVQVPKSQNGNPAVDDGPVYTVNGNCNGIPKLAIFDDNVAVNETLPEGYALDQNYPNPFNPSTMISFEVPEAIEVRIAIYNLKGQLIRTLHSGPIGAGYHRMIWEGTNSHGAVVASGTYIYSLEAKDFKISRKLVFIR